MSANSFGLLDIDLDFDFDFDLELKFLSFTWVLMWMGDGLWVMGDG